MGLVDIEDVDYMLSMLGEDVQFRESFNKRSVSCIGASSGGVELATAQAAERGGLVAGRKDRGGRKCFSLTPKGSRYLASYPFTDDESSFISGEEFSYRCASV